MAAGKLNAASEAGYTRDAGTKIVIRPRAFRDRCALLLFLRSEQGGPSFWLSRPDLRHRQYGFSSVVCAGIFLTSGKFNRALVIVVVRNPLRL
jgi:hypothetical protein